MQCIKESSPLRVSPTGQNPSPRIVFRYGEQDTNVNTITIQATNTMIIAITV